jgi:pimeloyl-ACP methyl ester carboxylesterase
MQETQTNSAAKATEHDWTTPDGHRMHYHKVGSGPPLLLIHGLVAYSFSWRFNLAALAPYFTCYAIDLVGMGDSDRPKGIDVSPRALAKGLTTFMREQSDEPWSVIGSSHGGGVAMWVERLARDAGTPLDRLVLVAPINPWSAHGRVIAPIAAHPITVALVWAFGFAYVPVRRMSFGRMYGDASLVTEATLQGYARPLYIKGTVRHCLALLKDWNHNVDELESVMREIKAPTLLVWGTKDRLVYLSSAERVRATIPNAHLVIIDGTGHLPYEEQPQQFNAAVVPFLRDGR